MWISLLAAQSCSTVFKINQKVLKTYLFDYDASKDVVLYPLEFVGPFNITINSEPCAVSSEQVLCYYPKPSQQSGQLRTTVACEKYPCQFRLAYLNQNPAELPQTGETKLNSALVSIRNDKKIQLSVVGQIEDKVYELGDVVFKNNKQLEFILSEDEQEAQVLLLPQAKPTIIKLANTSAKASFIYSTTQEEKSQTLSQKGTAKFAFGSDVEAKLNVTGFDKSLNLYLVVSCPEIIKPTSVQMYFQQPVSRQTKLVFSNAVKSFTVALGKVDIAAGSQLQLRFLSQQQLEMQASYYQDQALFLSPGQGNYLLFQAGNYSIRLDENQKMGSKQKIKVYLECAGAKNELALLPSGCDPAKGEKCKVTVQKKENSTCSLSIGSYTKQSQKQNMYQLTDSTTRKMLRMEKYYFYYQPQQLRDRLLQVGEQDVTIKLTFDKKCLPITKKCVEGEGSFGSPIEVQAGDTSAKKWYIQVVSLKTQYVSLSVVDMATGKKNLISLDQEVYSQLVEEESKVFSLITVNVTSPVQFKLYGASDRFVMTVKQGQAVHTTTSNYLIVSFPEETKILTLRVKQIAQRAKALSEFTLVATNANDLVFLAPGQTQFQCVPAKSSKQFLLSVNPKVSDLKLYLSSYETIKKPYEVKLKRGKEELELLFDKRRYFMLEQKELQQEWCSADSTFHIKEMEDEDEEQFCLFQLSFKNPTNNQICITVQQVNVNFTTFLEDGRTFYTNADEVQHFAFLIGDTDTSLALYAHCTFNPHLFSTLLYSPEPGNIKGQLPFPSSSNQPKISLSGYYTPEDLQKSCAEGRLCYLLLTVAPAPNTTNSNNNFFQSDVSIMLSTDSTQVQLGQDLMLTLAADQQKLITVDLANYFKNEDQSGLQVQLHRYSGSAILYLSLSSQKHVSYPSSVSYQVAVYDLLQLSHDQLLSYLDAADIDSSEPGLALHASLKAYTNSQSMLKISRSNKIAQVSPSMPYYFSLRGGQSKIIAYKKNIPGPFQVKVQKETGDASFSVVSCSGEKRCQNKAIFSTHILVLQNYQEHKVDQKLDKYCDTNCTYLIHILCTIDSSGYLNVQPANYGVTLVEDVPFSDFLQPSEKQAYSMFAKKDEFAFLTVRFSGSKPVITFPHSVESALLKENKFSLAYKARTSSFDSSISFQATCRGKCSYSLLYQVNFEGVFLVPGVLVSSLLTEGVSKTLLIYDNPLAEEANIDLAFMNSHDLEKVTIKYKGFGLGSARPSEESEIKADPNKVKEIRPTVRIPVKGASRAQVQIELLSPKAEVAFESTVSTNQLQVIEPGVVYPGSLKGEGAFAGYLLNVQQNDVFARVDVKSCVLTPFKVLVSASYEDYLNKKYIKVGQVGENQQFLSIQKVKEGELFVSTQTIKPGDSVYYSIRHDIVQSRAQYGSLLSAPNKGNIEFTQLDTNRVELRFAQLEGKNNSYFLLAGPDFASVYSQAKCPDLFFTELNTTGLRPKELSVAEAGGRLRAEMFLRGAQQSVVTVLGVTSKGEKVSYKIVDLKKGSRLGGGVVSNLVVGLAALIVCVWCRVRCAKPGGYRQVELDQF